ncbi:MAG: hypothetical protein LBF80_04810 [Spirochaetaceae bacterium]|jgi:hypothetical protein|nr:hypothetical protein [Spirochaetaceae bacterium]
MPRKSCFLLPCGRFNTDLVKQAQSPTAVHRFASARFEGSYIITQDVEGGVITLDKQSLQVPRGRDGIYDWAMRIIDEQWGKGNLS